MISMSMKDFAGRTGFMSDQKQIWGRYREYQFTIGCYGDNNAAITIFTAAVFADTSSYATLDAYFSELEKNKKINTYKLNRGTITVTKNFFAGSYTADDLQSILDAVVDKYVELGASPACFNCNQTGAKLFARYNGVVIPVCDQCFTGIQARIHQDQAKYNNSQNHYLSGSVGAILGALIGSIAWVIVGLLGYFAAIAGFAISFCASKGYTLLKGKVTRLTPWIIGLASIFAMVIAQFVTLDLIFYRELNADGVVVSLWDALSLTFQIPFIDPEVTSEFVKDTLLGLVFVVLGSFSTIRKISGTAAIPAGSIERV